MQMTRRDFLNALGCSAICLSLPELASAAQPVLKEAWFYKKLTDNRVQCQNCPRACTLGPKQRGLCRARENINGILYTLVYGNPCAVHIDPIEKKPLFHFLPNTTVFSLATAGCNMRCKFCQNWQISQAGPEQLEAISLSPQQVALETKKYKCQSAAYTYTEPTTFVEYTIDSCQAVRAAGLKNSMHSNGGCAHEPMLRLLENLDAVNIDLKSFSKKYYQDICEGDLSMVLQNLKTIRNKGVWLELTNLIVPTLNDNLEEIKEMCAWIKENLGDSVPMHFSRFTPMYKLLNLPPTPIKTLEGAREIALAAGLKFVYIGNVPGHQGEHTYCPNCKKVLIERVGYSVLRNELLSGQCRFCRTTIPGIWT